MDDPSVRQTRNTAQTCSVVDDMFDVVEEYITKLWLEMRERYQYTDLSAGPTSFSEAPAESVFSVWERVSEGRGSMTIGNTVSLVRVAMEGPGASTNDSLRLSRRALARWPGHLGERFTTKRWIPGGISETVKKIQEK